ncbi:hypothetical protein P2R91_24305, partial [Escherichia coli]
ADRNRSHWSTSKTPSYTKSVSWHHHQPLVSIDDYQTTDNKKEKNYCSPKPTFGLLRMFNKFSLI